MFGRMPFPEVTPRDVKQRIDAGEDITIIDVREPDEIKFVAVDGARALPMSQAGEWIDTLPRDGELVIMCHHGSRSAQVAMALVQRGHTNVSNMNGGIDQWAQQVDPTLPRY